MTRKTGKAQEAWLAACEREEVEGKRERQAKKRRKAEQQPNTLGFLRKVLGVKGFLGQG